MSAPVLQCAMIVANTRGRFATATDFFTETSSPSLRKARTAWSVAAATAEAAWNPSPCAIMVRSSTYNFSATGQALRSAYTVSVKSSRSSDVAMPEPAVMPRVATSSSE